MDIESDVVDHTTGMPATMKPASAETIDFDALCKRWITTDDEGHSAMTAYESLMECVVTVDGYNEVSFEGTYLNVLEALRRKPSLRWGARTKIRTFLEFTQYFLDSRGDRQAFLRPNKKLLTGCVAVVGALENFNLRSFDRDPVTGERPVPEMDDIPGYIMSVLDMLRADSPPEDIEARDLVTLYDYYSDHFHELRSIFRTYLVCSDGHVDVCKTMGKAIVYAKDHPTEAVRRC